MGLQENSSIQASYATGNVNGDSGSDIVGGLVGLESNSSIVTSYATGSANGDGGGDRVGGLVGQQENNSSITASYSTGSTNGDGGGDRVGGLVGDQNGSSITASYSTGSANGDLDDDDVGGLVGRQSGSPTVTASYGFGAVMTDGMETPADIGVMSSATSPWPMSVNSANGLTAMNAGTEWSPDAWNFGSPSQIPALKYVDSYDSGAGTYTCTATTAFLPAIQITCGTTLLPGQR